MTQKEILKKTEKAIIGICKKKNVFIGQLLYKKINDESEQTIIIRIDYGFYKKNTKEIIMDNYRIIPIRVFNKKLWSGYCIKIDSLLKTIRNKYKIPVAMPKRIISNPRKLL